MTEELESTSVQSKVSAGSDLPVVAPGTVHNTSQDNASELPGVDLPLKATAPIQDTSQDIASGLPSVDLPPPATSATQIISQDNASELLHPDLPVKSTAPIQDTSQDTASGLPSVDLPPTGTSATEEFSRDNAGIAQVIPQEALAQLDNPVSQPARSKPGESAESVALVPTKGLTAKDFFDTLTMELKRNRVPLLLIASIFICPFVIFLWLAVVLAWTGLEWLVPKLSVKNQAKMRALLPARIKYADWFQELAEGVEQARPFIITGVYFLCAPIAVIWMLWHWVRTLTGREKRNAPAIVTRNPDSIFLVQNRQAESREDENNFFHSPVFGVTLLGLCASGLPSLLTYWLYFALGIDAMFGHPSLNPKFHSTFLIVGLYLASIGWCLSVLFFRAWFSFPMNFSSQEQLVELNEAGIKKHPIKGWFASAMLLNRPNQGVDRLQWIDIRELRYDGGRGMRLHPMPQMGTFNSSSLFYRVIDKFAAFFDGAVDKLGRCEYVVVATGSNSTDYKISLNLWELDSEERARLFYAARKWAPHVMADKLTQEKLLGTSVISEPRYTELWFELLGSSKRRIRQAALQEGDSLTQRDMTIVRRIGSGGQASVYLARSTNGEECVLKEFILSSGDAVGALIDSARDFENEVSLLSQLSHRGIVALRDFFVEDRRAYIVLAHISGQSIRQQVRTEGKIDERKAASLAVQMCEILQYLHGQIPPVVHRDVTPDNFILKDDGTLTLIDFSLASGADTGRTSTTCMGKHGYTPPEQFQEEDCPQSDIYAFGATLYFMLTGMDPKPISRSSPVARNDTISAAMNQIVEKATELSLNNRYESVRWLRLDLESLVANSAPAPAPLEVETITS